MTSHIDSLCDRLYRRAGEMGWRVEREPPHLCAPHFSVLDDDLDSNSWGHATLRAELDKSRRGMFLGDFSVMVGDLGAVQSRAFEALSLHLEQAAKARSHLGVRKENLVLFVVAPSGVSGERPWLDIAHTIERDERICRKMVFLPPALDEDIDDAISLFLDRTFLAQPWLGVQLEADLDPLRTTLAEAGIPPNWVALINGGIIEGEDLIDKLLVTMTASGVADE